MSWFPPSPRPQADLNVDPASARQRETAKTEAAGRVAMLRGAEPSRVGSEGHIRGLLGRVRAIVRRRD